MIETLITIDTDADAIQNAITPEMEKHLRSSVKITKEGKILKFHIKADDATAFRATINSISQMLNVFYKVKEIK